MTKLSQRTSVLLARALGNYLVREGSVALLGEIARRLKGLLLYRIPLTSPSDMQALNVDYWRLTRAQTARRGPLEILEGPKISVLMPVYNVPEKWLRLAIRSVLSQSYGNWQLCIADDASNASHIRQVIDESVALDGRIDAIFLPENVGIGQASNAALRLASGEYVALLDNDDELHPDALLEVVKLLNQMPSPDLVYTDEDKLVSKGRRVDPFFKPSWSPDLLGSMNYITHLSVFSRSLLEELGGFRGGFDGSQDYDLLLRFTERTERVVHVPKVLYHWRQIPGSAASSIHAKPYAYDAARKALQESLARRGYQGTVEVEAPGRYRMRYRTPAEPRIAMIGSDEGDSEELAREAARSRCSLIMIGASPTWASAANAGAAACDADYLLFTRDLVEVIDAEWVQSMLEHCFRPEVGVVGGSVIGGHKRFLEAGIALDAERLLAFPFEGLPYTYYGYKSLPRAVRNVTAVSGACLMIRKDLFEDVGGFEEIGSPYAEVDLCLKLLDRGLYNVFTPYARVKVRRSGRLPVREQDAVALRQRWGQRIQMGDSFFSSNLVMREGSLRLRTSNS